MANYTSSVLVDAIGILQGRFQSKEFRRPLYGAHDLFLKDRDYSIPNLDQIRLSENRTTTTKYLTKVTPTVGSARACSPTASYGDSGTVDLSWTAYSATAKISDKMHRNNYFDPAKALAAQLEGCFREIHDDIEAAAVAYLELYKSGVNSGDDWMGTFDTTNDIFPITLANVANYYEYIATIMKENKYYGPYMAVQNVSAQAIMNYQMAQGAGNSTNLTYNYGDIDFMASHSVTSGSDYRIISYVAEPSTVAMLDWVPGINRKGDQVADAKWYTMADLYGFPIQFAVYEKVACADTTATGGAPQDKVVTYEVSTDISFARAPISVSTEEAIFKFGLTSS
jgi:hypothetical protein